MTLEAQLGIIVRGFRLDPIRYGPMLRDLRRQHSQNFLDAAAVILRDAQDSPGVAYLLASLGSDNQWIPLLVRLAQNKAPSLSHIARTAMKDQPSIYLQLMKRMDSESDESAILHYIEVLESATNGLKMAPVLRKLMLSDHPKVRSKATLLMGRVVLSEDWFTTRLTEVDARVRANAVEALWDVDLPRRRAIFEIATRDPSVRVATNGWIGMYKADAVESLKGLESMSASADASVRSAAAWAMGYTQDNRFLPELERLRNDTVAAVQVNARKAIDLIQKQADAQPDNAHLTLLRTTPGQLEFTLTSSGGNVITQLKALDVRTVVAGKPVLDYALEAVAAPQALSVRVVHPDSQSDRAFAHALRQLVQRKRPADDWNVTAYVAGPPRPGAFALPDAVLAAVRSSGALRKSRHILVVLPEECSGTSWPPGQMHSIQAELEESRIIIHVVSEQPAWRKWQELADQTGGFSLVAGPLDKSGPLLAALASALVHRWQLRFHSPDSGPGAEIAIRVTAEHLCARTVSTFSKERDPG